MDIVKDIQAFFDGRYILKTLLVLILVCLVIQRSQTKRLACYYSPQNKLMNKFYSQSNIATMVFRPYIFAVHTLLQLGFYVVIDVAYMTICTPKKDRELVVAKDGTTIGLDWLCDPGKDKAIPQAKNSSTTSPPNSQPSTPQRPICLFVPGLGGSPNHFYQRTLQN